MCFAEAQQLQNPFGLRICGPVSIASGVNDLKDDLTNEQSCSTGHQRTPDGLTNFARCRPCMASNIDQGPSEEEQQKYKTCVHRATGLDSNVKAAAKIGSICSVSGSSLSHSRWAALRSCGGPVTYPRGCSLCTRQKQYSRQPGLRSGAAARYRRCCCRNPTLASRQSSAHTEARFKRVGRGHYCMIHRS